MDLSKALQEKKFDTRLIDFNLSQEFVKPEELKKHLESLPDLAAHAEALTLEDKDDLNGMGLNGNYMS